MGTRLLDSLDSSSSSFSSSASRPSLSSSTSNEGIITSFGGQTGDVGGGGGVCGGCGDGVFSIHVAGSVHASMGSLLLVAQRLRRDISRAAVAVAEAEAEALTAASTAALTAGEEGAAKQREEELLRLVEKRTQKIARLVSEERRKEI